jgi:hypothetical protein
VNRQLTIVKRQTSSRPSSAIGIGIGNRQSAIGNRQSAIGNRLEIRAAQVPE